MFQKLPLLVNRPHWLQHFIACNFCLVILLALYNLATYFIPLIHLKTAGDLTILVIADGLCILGQLVALDNQSK